MTTNYNGEHAILFRREEDDKSGVHTWNDWFLIPTSKPIIDPPTPVTKFVEIPGRSGSYDMTNYLNTGPVYGDRSGSFEFVIASDRTTWQEAMTRILTYLHGQRADMALTDDRNWYYNGRFLVDSHKSEQRYDKIVINYRVKPFKISVDATYLDDSVWNPFIFVPDDSWSENRLITLNNSRRVISVAPSTLHSNPLIVRFPESSYNSGDRVTASFGGVTKVLYASMQEEMLGTKSATTATDFILEGTGTVESGWKFVSL